MGHTRVPVFDGSAERIVGIVTIKDVLRTVARGEPPVLAGLMRPPLFVPEGAPISALLREIVGDIRDETETTPTFVSRLPDGAYLVDGMTPINEPERSLGVTLAEPGDYNTVAGFILATTTTVPAPGATFVCAGRRWTVVEMEGPRIRCVRVEPT